MYRYYEMKSSMLFINFYARLSSFMPIKTKCHPKSVFVLMFSAHCAQWHLFVMLLYIPSQQLWSCLDGQFTLPHFFQGKLEQAVNQYRTGPGSNSGTPRSAVRLTSVARHVSDCAMWLGTTQWHFDILRKQHSDYDQGL